MGASGFAVFCMNFMILVGLFLILPVRMQEGTNPVDVAAITSLYAALESPPLPGWSQNGNPCNGIWQGVACDQANIVSIIINGANLGGSLGNELGSFSSIKIIDLSNNHIGGTIPSNLPFTLENLFLSDNNFTGNVPNSLSSMSNLSAMSLNGNQLTGEIPDSFEGLVHLVNLDLSGNSLSGGLPQSLGNMSLATLHLQNNQLSGTLDVLQDLPLTDLNVENNLFSGPIPQKLLAIPNFKKEGNPFNSSDAPSPSPTPSKTPSAPPSLGAPTSAPTLPSTAASGPGKQAGGPSATEGPNSKKNKSSAAARKIVWISIACVMSFIVLVLAVLLCFPKRLWKRQDSPRIHKRRNVEKALAAVRSNDEHKLSRLASATKPQTVPDASAESLSVIPRGSHESSMSIFDIDAMTPPPPPPNLQNWLTSAQKPIDKSSMRQLPPSSVKSYTIADLQQYTNSFSQDNLIGVGTLGRVYKADLPGGRCLAVKQLHKEVCNGQKDEEFAELVSSIAGLCHDNVVKLAAYCAEHGERLLLYEYFRNGTLQDALHTSYEFKKNLSWNMRIKMALGASRALEYMHESCDPPVVHRNFKSANVLLDDQLDVHISDCGLAPLISSGAVSKLSGQLLTTYGYDAPEFELGIYTLQSDVYSFGVVMLELLTGRKSCDRTRVHGEQFLVRWALPQLHNIDALKEMVDPSLEGNYPIKSLSRFADIISRCVQEEPEFRPPMSQVVQDIMQMMEREASNRVDYDSRLELTRVERQSNR